MSWEDVLKLKSESRGIMDEIDKFESSQKKLIDISSFILNVYGKIKRVRFPTRSIGQPVKISLFTISTALLQVVNLRYKLRRRKTEHLWEQLVEINDWAGEE